MCNNGNNTLIKSLVSQIEYRNIIIKQFERELEINKIKLKEESTKLINAIRLNKILITLLIVKIISYVYSYVNNL